MTNSLEKKSDTVRRLVSNGEYKKALGIVKGFRLGIKREDSGKMLLAYECMVHPDFYSELGTEVEMAIADGIRILEFHYGKRR